MTAFDMGLQDVPTKVFLEVAPDGMRVVGVILRVIVFQQKRRALQAEIALLAPFQPTRPAETNPPADAKMEAPASPEVKMEGSDEQHHDRSRDV